MNEIDTNQANITVDQEINTSLFNDFVRWLDRPEKTTKTYMKNLKQFAAWLRFAAILKPEREDIINYREWLLSEHEAIRLDLDNVKGWSFRTDRKGNRIILKCKVNTVRQYIRTVCQLFRWMASNGIYPDIAANIHTPITNSAERHAKDALEPDEVMAIERSILKNAERRKNEASEAAKDTAGRIQRAEEQSKRIYAMYLLAVNTGMRTIELSRANVSDFETKKDASWIYIHGKRHGEADTKKPITPEIATALQDYLKSRTDKPTGKSPLFAATGNRHGGKRLAATTISTMLKRAMVEAGFKSERLTAHSLRHTTGTNVMEVTGNNIYVTQRYMRHSNPKTTEIYLHVETEREEITIAQQLYNLYHGIKVDSREKLENIINRLSPKQIERLTGIAETMA